MASSMKYILAPLALLFLVALTTPRVSAQGSSGFNIIVTGTLYCSPNVTHCTPTPLVPACPPLVGALVTLPLLGQTFTTTTDSSGKFSFNVSIPAPTFNALSSITNPTSLLVLPVSTCSTLSAFAGGFAETLVSIAQVIGTTLVGTVGN